MSLIIRGSERLGLSGLIGALPARRMTFGAGGQFDDVPLEMLLGSFLRLVSMAAVAGVLLEIAGGRMASRTFASIFAAAVIDRELVEFGGDRGPFPSRRRVTFGAIGAEAPLMYFRLGVAGDA